MNAAERREAWGTSAPHPPGLVLAPAAPDRLGMAAWGGLRSPAPLCQPTRARLLHTRYPPTAPTRTCCPPQVDRKVLQLEMEKLSLKKAAEGNDRGARQRLAALESQLEGEPGGGGCRVCGRVCRKGWGLECVGGGLGETAPGPAGWPSTGLLTGGSQHRSRALHRVAAPASVPHPRPCPLPLRPPCSAGEAAEGAAGDVGGGTRRDGARAAAQGGD